MSQTLDPNQIYRSVSQTQEHFVPQVENNSYYYNEKTGKHYFKVFLLNNKFNKRKFRVANLNNLDKDVEGYENLPVTFVAEGPRKGNHPNPKDANIFEANYQNKYTYVTKAIEYYRNFGVAKIVKIYKPDRNILTASATNPDNVLNYFALCETENQNMINLLEQAKIHDKNIYVSPAMFSWDWTKDPDSGHVSVNSFVPTHLAIVDSPAYDTEIAYIKKQTCQKDGMSCYYELFEANDIENLNNNNQQSNNMSSNKFPGTLEEYVKSYWSMDVIDTKNVNAEDLVKNMSNYIIIDKSKVNNKPNNPEPQQQQEQQKQIPIPTQSPPQQEESKPVQKEETTTKKETVQKASFTLDDVKALLAEQKDSILKEIKAEQTKGAREELLNSYIQNEKVKSLQDKIDKEKLNKTKELYNSLPLDNDQLKVLLNNSIYNPEFANENIYTSVLAISEQNREINQKEIETQPKPQPQGAPKDPAIPKPNIAKTNIVETSQQKTITDIPAKPNANMNMFGTEFKNSADSSNKYNDQYNSKGKDFTASKTDNDYRPTPTTGEGTPKRFQKYIQ
jgi:hypothetical protein